MQFRKTFPTFDRYETLEKPGGEFLLKNDQEENRPPVKVKRLEQSVN